MIKRYLFTLAVLLCSVLAIAQPANDECDTAINIPDVSDWCSAAATYTNVGATASGFGPASCFDSANNDVWFSFTAIATDVVITVIGDQSIGGGGTLNNPSVALYDGTCAGTIGQFQCETDAVNNNIVELYKGGLTVGETYLIRINGRAGNTGTFELCINNFYPPVEPGSDCPTAAILCDKSPFAIQSVVGAGNDTDEADGTCLDAGAQGNSESNSTWFTWTAATNGTLTFTLTPTNPADDLDFVIFELPNGVNNCSGKNPILCMASGEFGTSNAPCMGPTGLMAGDTDTVENPGCDPGNNNFLQPLNMLAGVSYGLLINNFTSTGNGFSISWGGTGEFVGPVASFTDNDPDDILCAGESVTFQDASSFSLGMVTGWEWNFGVGATPATASGQGPHNVVFTEPGEASVVLTVETDLGCIVTEVGVFQVEPCCNSLNQMFASYTSMDLICADDLDGFIDVEVTGGTPPFIYNWSTGDVGQDLTGLAPGDYSVTIEDQIGCDTIFNVTLTGPPAFDYAEDITMPTCNGGMDGAVNLTIGGATPPYSFQWTDTNTGTSLGTNEDLNNIPIGDYTVVITDANNCQITRDFEVRELELILDPNANVITSPSCYGESDGTIQVTIANGLAPYAYDLNDGNGFTSANVIAGVAAGTYMVTVRDANFCFGNFEIEVQQPDSLIVDLLVMDISCFGYDDGMISADAMGGTGDYTYNWSPAFGDTSMIADLVPGDYFLTVTDENGCAATADAMIIEPAEVGIDSIIVQDNVCFGASDGQMTVYAFGGNPPFEYSSDGINFQTDSLLTGLEAGTYTITIRDIFGCDFSSTASISEPFELILDARYDQEVDLGYSANIDAVLLNSNVEHTIEWTPAAGLSCTDCFDPIATPVQTTNYVATITTVQGCTATDSLTITVNDVRPVYIPNVFSPNYDGTNDVFMVHGGLAVSQVLEFNVFDRWGGLVFQAENVPTDDSQFGWDGSVKGKAVNNGVYVYIAKVEYIDGVVIDYKGSVTVVK